MAKKIQLPPLRKPVIDGLPENDAAFVLTGENSVQKKSSSGFKQIPPTRISTADLKNNLSEIVNEMESKGEIVLMTRHGVDVLCAIPITAKTLYTLKSKQGDTNSSVLAKCVIPICTTKLSFGNIDTDMPRLPEKRYILTISICELEEK